MAKTFQSFEHHRSAYDRPSQGWVCGHAADGKVCPLGPDGRGRCRGGGECLPSLSGDRWVCTRGDDRGGPCPGGPSPDGACGCPLAKCSPRRPLRRLRRRAVLLTLGATAGLLLVFFGGPAGRGHHFANPGPLTHAHSSESMECADCHRSGGGEARGSVFSPGARVTNAACLVCHGDIDPSGGLAGFAHGIGPRALAASAERARGHGPSSGGLLSAITSPLREAGLDGTLACASCHREHHGKHSELATLSDRQCQTCHLRKFDDFSKGHPSFAQTRYPYTRRTQIVFDHGAHYGKHFGERPEHAPAGFDPAAVGVESQSCSACHQPDARGKQMELASYEVSCAGCHEKAVHGGDPLTILTLPQAPADLGVPGRWPESGLGVTPAMLAALPDVARRAADALGALPESDQLGLATGTAEERAASRSVAAAIQELYHEMWKEGPAAFARRLSSRGVAPPGGTGDAFAPLAGLGIDSLRRLLFPGVRWELGEFAFPELDRGALDAWLAGRGRSVGLWPSGAGAPLTPLLQRVLEQDDDLRAALATLAAGDRTLADLDGASAEEFAAAEAVAWTIKDLHARIADQGAPFLQQFVELSGGILDTGAEDAILEKVFFAARDDASYLAGYRDEWRRWQRGLFPPPVSGPTPDGDGAPPSPATGEEDDDFGEGDDDDFGEGDDDFGEEDAGSAGDDDFGEEEVGVAGDDDFGEEETGVAGDDGFGEDETGAAGDDDFGAPPDRGEAEQKAPAEFSVYEPSSLADWQRYGGWLHDSHALKYASRGHSDEVIRAWLEGAIAAANSEDPLRRADGRRLLHSTLGLRDGVLSEASGRCLKCHSVDVSRGPEGRERFEIHWRAGAAGAHYPLTTFDHSKHIRAVSCTQCHRLGEGDGYAAQFPGRRSWATPAGAPDHLPPSPSVSNFLQMDRLQSCASCHQPEAAGNHCLQCHQYHARPVVPRR